MALARLRYRRLQVFRSPKTLGAPYPLPLLHPRNYSQSARRSTRAIRDHPRDPITAPLIDLTILKHIIENELISKW